MGHTVPVVRAAVLAMLVACSGSSGSSGEVPPPPKTAHELCVALWGASSAKAVECLTWGASWVADDVAAQMPIACDRVQEGVDAGRLVFDADVAEACIAAFGALTCPEYENHLDAPCGWLAGTVTLGEACTSSDECAAGWCDHGSACPGTCAAFAALGQDCTATRCGPGLACASPEKTCVEAVAPGAEGEPCGNARAACEAGLYCAGGTCLPRQTYYEECTGARCTWEHECVPDGTLSYCFPVLPEGADCALGFDAVCVRGTWCDGAKCRSNALPIGTSCALPYPGYSPCSRGYCDSSLVCARWRVAGETCGPDMLCNPYLECVNGVCSDLVCWG